LASEDSAAGIVLYIRMRNFQCPPLNTGKTLKKGVVEFGSQPFEHIITLHIIAVYGSNIIPAQ
jgi:isoprenylcysteine carboxyl methyltransferase (ICMT) family protein YpbQ